MRTFIRLWVWFSFRQFRRNAWRSLAVLLGIGLGAAVFTSVRLATNASVQSFSNSIDAISGKADRTIVKPGGRVPENIVADLLSAPEIRAASPLLTAYVRTEGLPAEPILLIGIDPILDRSFRGWRIAPTGSRDIRGKWQELLSSPYTLLAGRNFLQKAGLAPGDPVRLQSANRIDSFRILGELVPEGLASLEGGNVAITDIATFQEFTGTFGQVDRIDIIFNSPVTDQKVNAATALLPAGVFLERPSEIKETGQAMIRSYQLNLSVLSFVSLFVGMFLVYSLISLNASSRRKELAILRSVGASRCTVFFLFIAEGSFFGISGWLLAIPTSFIMTKELVGYVSSTVTQLFARVYVEDIGLTSFEVFLSFGITVLVAVAAACQPAFEASRVRAREALLMREAPDMQEGTIVERLALLGLALTAAVWPLSRLPGIAGIPVPGYLAAFFLFLGFALLSPFCLRAAGSYLPPLARHAAGETAYIGIRYLKDAGPRVAISAGALITAIGLFTALVIMVHSFRDTVHTWVNQSINGDLYVRTKMADLNRYRDPLPPDTVGMLRGLQNEADMTPYRRISLDYGGLPYVLEPIETGNFSRHSKFLFLDGDAEKILPPLDSGKGVVVSEVFSNRTGLRTGDRYRAVVAGTALELPILGIIRDYRTQGGVVNCSLSFFESTTGDFGWTGASIFLKDRGPGIQERIAALRDRILVDASTHGYSLESTVGNDLRRNILRIFDETFAITTVLLFISLLIAALGVATTLTILVLEREQLFQTMLATGASMGQIRAVITWEAVMMVVIGEVLGLACGFALSILLIFVINMQSFGWTFVYSVDWTALATSLPLVCMTALLAALPAAQVVFRRPAAMVLRGK
jgi:putative ABC transport system permease protein